MSTFRQTAKDAAEQSERASIDITTLESMMADIIGSLQDIDAAQAKGREYREKATQRIGELRDQIKLQLTTTINNKVNKKMKKKKTTEPRPESLLSNFLETEEFSLKDSPMFQELIENIKNNQTY